MNHKQRDQLFHFPLLFYFIPKRCSDGMDYHRSIFLYWGLIINTIFLKSTSFRSQYQMDVSDRKWAKNHNRVIPIKLLANSYRFS